MTQTCSQCGMINSDTAHFCNQCGLAFAAGARQGAGGTGMLSANTLLSDRYIIVRRVGQGGMGAVYQAADSRIQGKVWAIKEMSDAALTNPLDKQQAVQAFQREAQLLSLLSHANIPHVSDFFSQGGKQYLVMEFVEGETLEDIMDHRGRPLAEAEVLPWAEQLCDVLDYLHCRQPPVIFRDLKPANIMIDGTGSVKLIDFGIVRFFQPGKTKDTTSFGTAGYAPPEQYGKGQTDARSDIYALGATLHFLLTACDPSLSPFQFQPVRALNPRVSAGMEQAIARALEQDPGRRWLTARAMKQALSAPAARPQPASQPVAVAASHAPVMAAAQPQPAAQSVSVGPMRYGATVAPTRLAPPPHPRQAVPTMWNVELAGFGRRATAYIVDSVLLYLIQILLAIPVGVVSESSTEDVAAALSCVTLLTSITLYVWYFVFLQARSGQTPGKKLLGIRVVGTDGGPVSRGRYLLRLIGYWLDGLLLGIGFLMALWDSNHQALHDKLANTYVERC